MTTKQDILFFTSMNLIFVGWTGPSFRRKWTEDLFLKSTGPVERNSTTFFLKLNLILTTQVRGVDGELTYGNSVRNRQFYPWCMECFVYKPCVLLLHILFRPVDTLGYV